MEAAWSERVGENNGHKTNQNWLKNWILCQLAWASYARYLSVAFSLDVKEKIVIVRSRPLRKELIMLLAGGFQMMLRSLKFADNSKNLQKDKRETVQDFVSTGKEEQIRWHQFGFAGQEKDFILYPKNERLMLSDVVKMDNYASVFGPVPGTWVLL